MTHANKDERALLEINRNMTYGARRALLEMAVQLQSRFPWEEGAGEANKR